MSRSGYTDEHDSSFQLYAYRRQVGSATQGKRGQRFFRELLAALDAMPEKRLISNSLANEEGVCALGALGRAKGTPLPQLDEDDWDGHGDRLGPLFDIAPQLAAEVMYMNDERNEDANPEERWQKMRAWAVRQIVPTEAELEPLP